MEKNMENYHNMLGRESHPANTKPQGACLLSTLPPQCQQRIRGVHPRNVHECWRGRRETKCSDETGITIRAQKPGLEKEITGTASDGGRNLDTFLIHAQSRSLSKPTNGSRTRRALTGKATTRISSAALPWLLAFPTHENLRDE